VFVTSHPSKDVTFEGIHKTYRPRWQTVADLASRVSEKMCSVTGERVFSLTRALFKLLA
jgi:hypothetical protein